MEKNAGDGLKYYLSVGANHKDDLARIRHWSNLKVGLDGDTIWIKDLDYTQIISVEVRSIPFKTTYYEKANRLFLLDHNLPERNLPSLLWTSIDRALPVTIPALNHNLFGTPERIQINLAPRNTETDTVAATASFHVLEQYINHAPAMRLDRIRWVLLHGEALLLGTPPLPIPGNTYWARKDHLIPTGLDFELFILSDLIQRKINPGRDHWILWTASGSYSLVPKANFATLTKSSFRLTMRNPNIPRT